MRGKPGRTERRVGLFVLALLACIVLAFLLTGGLFKDFVDSHPTLVRARDFFGISEKPLFLADPANLPPAPPARELRLAESLLPASLGDGQLVGGGVTAWPIRSDADAQKAVAAGVDAVLCKAAQAGNARWIYCQSYASAAAKTPVVVVAVADMGEPTGAYALFKSRTPGEGRPLAMARGGWIAGDRAGFWSGRYYTEVRADHASASPVEAVARSLASLQLNYGMPFASSSPAPTAIAKTDTPPAAAESAGVARFAEVPGGRLVAPVKIERYADNIYEKIDGKESAYRSFFVVDLKFAQYSDPDAQQTYDVYIYDMAAPVNAFGIYMSERVANAAVVNVGREGYASGTSVFTWKGQYYINVLGPADAGDAALNNSKQITAAVVETIADDGKPFWADKVLPSEGRVPFTFSYQATSALGYEFLNRMWFAKYEADGHTLQMFLTKATDAQAARSLFSQFAEAVGRYDKVLGKETVEGGEILRSETPMLNRPSKFGAAFCKGPYFGGASGSNDKDFASGRVKLLFDSLSAGDAGDPEAAVKAPVPAESSHDAAGEGGAPSEGGASEGNESGK